MPLYTWQSQSSEKEVKVLRSFDDYDVPPTEEEADGDEGPWKKLIKPGTSVIRGMNWQGKGNWIWPGLILSEVFNANTWLL